jgi:hypothetical protein
MIDPKAKEVIDKAISLNGRGGVKTIPLIDGSLMSNYVEFRTYFKSYVWTEEMSEYVKSLFFSPEVVKIKQDLISFTELRERFLRVALKAGFNERWFNSLAESHGLPFMSSYIMSELWVKKIPEDEDTEFFRKQQLVLREHGCFNVLK